MGASIGSGSTTDYSRFRCAHSSTRSDDAFDILADIVQNPAFAAGGDRARARQSPDAGVQQKDNPDAVARAVLYEALYGKSHPYGYIELGTAGSVAAISSVTNCGFLAQGLCAGQCRADRCRRRDRGRAARAWRRRISASGVVKQALPPAARSAAEVNARIARGG